VRSIHTHMRACTRPYPPTHTHARTHTQVLKLNSCPASGSPTGKGAAGPATAKGCGGGPGTPKGGGGATPSVGARGGGGDKSFMEDVDVGVGGGGGEEEEEMSLEVRRISTNMHRWIYLGGDQE
jgi:hypothetical protein